MLKRVLSATALLFVLAACTQLGPAPAVTVTVTPAPDATNVSVNAVVTAVFSADMDESTVTGSFTLSTGGLTVAGDLEYDAATRTATFTPDVPLAYSTQYTATVDGSVRSKAGGKLAGSYSWSFTTAAEPIVPAITSVTVSPATAARLVGETVQLTANVTAVGGADQSVTWGSSNPGVATVTPTGLVTGMSAGTATITATSVFDTSVSGSATVTISAVPAVTGITVTPATSDVVAGETVQLNAQVDAAGGADQSVTWGSSNPGVATVSATGLVTTVAAGSATITATSVFNNSITGSATVTAWGELTAGDYVSEVGYLSGEAVDIAAPAVSGGMAPITFDVTAGALPDGVTLGADGSISGSSTVPGAYSGTVTVADALGQTATADFSFGIADPLEVNLFIGATHPAGTTLPAPLPFVASGGLAPFDFELIVVDPDDPEWADRFAPGGPWDYHLIEDQTDIPADLEIIDGALQGTLNAVGFFRFYIRTTDAMGQTDVSQVEIDSTRTLTLAYSQASYVYLPGDTGTIVPAPTVTAEGFLEEPEYTFSMALTGCSSVTCSGARWSIGADGAINRVMGSNNTSAGNNSDRTYEVTVTETNTGETATATVVINLPAPVLTYTPNPYAYNLGAGISLSPSISLPGYGGTITASYSWTRTACSVAGCSDTRWSIGTTNGIITRNGFGQGNTAATANGNRTYDVTVSVSGGAPVTVTVQFNQNP